MSNFAGKAEELWEKYSETIGFGLGTQVCVDKSKFLAALSEYAKLYGDMVRKEDAEITERAFETTIDRGEHTPDDYVYSENVAAAISNKELPELP